LFKAVTLETAKIVFMTDRSAGADLSDRGLGAGGMVSNFGLAAFGRLSGGAGAKDQGQQHKE
jgi:hypothetical protein